MDETVYGTDIHNSWMGDGRGDWQLSRGQDNLYQSLYNRLLTVRDELTHLGYVDYGTISVEGEPGTPGVLDLAVVYTEDSLQRDPRVASVEVISFDLTDKVLTVEIDVTPITDNSSTNMVLNIPVTQTGDMI